MIADALELCVFLAAVAVCDCARRDERSVDAMDAVYARTLIRDRRSLPRIEALIEAVFGLEIAPCAAQRTPAFN